jgi:four helix bundle protein
MKNTKQQTSNIKETANTKQQPVPLVDGWHLIAPLVVKESWILKDEPAKENPARHPFDLEERTAVFGERIVRFAKSMPRHPANDRLISQIVGAGTSIGANYCEANDSLSKKDFRHSVSRSVKEAKESRYFLRMIAASEPALAAEARETVARSN